MPTLTDLDKAQLPDVVEWDTSSETGKQMEDIIKTLSGIAIMEVNYGNNAIMKATVEQYNAMVKHFLDDAYKTYEPINDGTLNQHHRATFTVNADLSAINHYVAVLRDHMIEHCVQGINSLRPLINN